jgi:acyl-CoA thioesterase I
VDERQPVLIPPRGGGDVGDYSLRDFAAKWLVQQADLAEIARYRSANAAVLNDSDPRDRVVLIGDSITEFWDDASALAGPTWRTVNRGIAGQNSTQMLLRFEADVVDLAPRLAVLLCGTNDLRSYAGSPALIADSAGDRIRRNVTAMADIASGRGFQLALCTVPPVGRQPDVYRDAGAIRSINSWIVDFAGQRGLRVADYYSALADNDGSLSLTLSDDGVHPNKLGYARMIDVLRPLLVGADCWSDDTQRKASAQDHLA